MQLPQFTDKWRRADHIAGGPGFDDQDSHVGGRVFRTTDIACSSAKLVLLAWRISIEKTAVGTDFRHDLVYQLFQNLRAKNQKKLPLDIGRDSLLPANSRI